MYPVLSCQVPFVDRVGQHDVTGAAGVHVAQREKGVYADRGELGGQDGAAGHKADGSCCDRGAQPGPLRRLIKAGEIGQIVPVEITGGAAPRGDRSPGHCVRDR